MPYDDAWNGNTFPVAIVLFAVANCLQSPIWHVQVINNQSLQSTRSALFIHEKVRSIWKVMGLLSQSAAAAVHSRYNYTWARPTSGHVWLDMRSSSHHPLLTLVMVVVLDDAITRSNAYFFLSRRKWHIFYPSPFLLLRKWFITAISHYNIASFSSFSHGKDTSMAHGACIKRIVVV